MIDKTTFHTTLFASLILALITGIWKFLGTILTKIKKIKRWREEEEIKLIIELGQDRLALVKSSRFIPTMGQTDKPHESDHINRSYDSFDLADMILKEIFSL